MDHKDFDNVLRNKLGELKDAGQMQPDWERMEKEINQDNLKDQAFDTQIKRKLAEIKVAHFNTNSWSLLYQLIDKRIKNKQAVLAYKSIELVLVFLLLITSLNLGYFENTKNNEKLDFTNTPQIAISQENFKEDQHIGDMDKVANVSHQAITKTIPSKPEITVKNNSGQSTVVRTKPNVNGSFTSNSLAELPGIDHHVVSSGLEGLQNSNLKISIIDSANSDIASEIITSAFESKRKEIDGSLISLLQLDGLPLKNNNLNHLQLVATKPITWFASVQSGYQFNNIESDVYESIVHGRNGSLVPEGSNNKKSMNAAFALEIGKTIGDFDISIGTGYQHVKYNPALNLTTGNITSKYTETSVESIGYQLLSIPLNLRWKAVSWKNWSASLQSSLINTILLKSEQQIKQRLIQGDRIQFVAQNEIDYSTLDYDFARGLGDEPIAIPNGILSNYFLRASVGTELSRKISPNISLFGTFNYIFNLPVKAQKFDQSDLINSQYFGIGIRKYVG